MQTIAYLIEKEKNAKESQNWNSNSNSNSTSPTKSKHAIKERAPPRIPDSPKCKPDMDSHIAVTLKLAELEGNNKLWIDDFKQSKDYINPSYTAVNQVSLFVCLFYLLTLFGLVCDCIYVCCDFAHFFFVCLLF